MAGSYCPQDWFRITCLLKAVLLIQWFSGKLPRQWRNKGVAFLCLSIVQESKSAFNTLDAVVLPSIGWVLFQESSRQEVLFLPFYCNFILVDVIAHVKIKHFICNFHFVSHKGGPWLEQLIVNQSIELLAVAIQKVQSVLNLPIFSYAARIPKSDPLTPLIESNSTKAMLPGPHCLAHLASFQAILLLNDA